MLKKGFTIVELLVVVVIIGIISAIVFVSYSGVNQKAIVTSLESDLAINAKKLKLYQVEYSSFPTALDANNCPTSPQISSTYCLNFSSDNTLDSYIGDSLTFTLQIKNNSNVMKITQDSSPDISATTTTETINGTAFVANNPFYSTDPSWGGDYDEEDWTEYRLEQVSTFDLSSFTDGTISEANLIWNYTYIGNPSGTGSCNRYLKFNTINLWTGACNSTVSSFNGADLTANMNTAKGSTFQINWKSDYGDAYNNDWGYQGGMSNPRITFKWTQ